MSKKERSDGNTKASLRTWCFTSYEVGKTYIDWLMKCDKFRYLLFQKEQCPTSKREHLQGVFCLVKGLTFNSVKKLLGNECHIEPCKSLEGSIKYCKKEESRIEGPWEKGEPSFQGKRSDLDDIKDMIKGGASLLDIAEKHTGSFIRYTRGIKRIKRSLNKRQNGMETRASHPYWTTRMW